MLLLAAVGTLAFVLMGAFVGARLLVMSRRTGQWPEFLAGGSLLLYCAVGQPAIGVSRVLRAAGGMVPYVGVLSLGIGALVISCLGLFLFTWVVFRSDSRWILRAILTTGVAAAGVGVTLVASLAQRQADTPYSTVTQVCIMLLAVDFSVAMGWAAAESYRYYGLMRRRLALGLADAVTANRFFVWATGCGAIPLIGIAMIGYVAAGMNMITDPRPLLTMSIGGLIAAACWYLSFFPPLSYKEWLRRRAKGRVPTC